MAEHVVAETLHAPAHLDTSRLNDLARRHALCREASDHLRLDNGSPAWQSLALKDLG